MSHGLNQPVPYVPPIRKQADQKFCYACGVIMHASAAECPACGARQPDVAATRLVSDAGTAIVEAPAHQVFCRGCGRLLHQQAPLCPHCGAPQGHSAVRPDDPEKSKVAAALLAFILGGFGAHKFYLGEIGLGVLYLLFCWTFIPAIVGLIEGIAYLAMSDERFARRFG